MSLRQRKDSEVTVLYVKDVGAVLTPKGAKHFENVEARLDLCERALRMILAPHGQDVSDRVGVVVESALLPETSQNDPEDRL